MDNTNKLELYMGRIARSLEDVASELMVLRLEVKQAVDKLDNADKETVGPIASHPPVSYTHLTQPTISSV